MITPSMATKMTHLEILKLREPMPMRMLIGVAITISFPMAGLAQGGARPAQVDPMAAYPACHQTLTTLINKSQDMMTRAEDGTSGITVDEGIKIGLAHAALTNVLTEVSILEAMAKVEPSLDANTKKLVYQPNRTYLVERIRFYRSSMEAIFAARQEPLPQAAPNPIATFDPKTSSWNKYQQYMSLMIQRLNWQLRAIY